MITMEKKIEESIEVYCQIYERIHQRVLESNHENAEGVTLKIFSEVARDLKDEIIIQKDDEKPQTTDRNEERLATKRQREALHKFGVKRIPEGLSLREASAILNKLISLSRANDRYGISKAVEELNRDWM